MSSSLRRRGFLFFLVLTCGPLGALAGTPPFPSDTAQAAKVHGSYYTGTYQDLFEDLLGKSKAQVKARIDNAFAQLFHGDDSTERVYYPAEPDMACMVDILHKDVRTEGMSYGMMIAVQLDKRDEFNRLWNWAKTFMQHRSEPRKNYLAWHCETNGAIIDSTAASDGEEWFVTALFFASARWGNGEGIFNYKAEAQAILDAMLNKEGKTSSDGKIMNMFSKKEKQVVFVPSVDAAGFTDPSYHLPHFYELWARWADKNKTFWCEAATVSRSFFKRAAHPSTGLMPDYAHFDGSPLDRWGGGNDDFRFDAWRVGMNVALDYAWFAKDSWEVTQSNRLLNFFHSQGIGTYGNLFKLNGTKIADDHSTGLVAMNAVACLASTNVNRRDFVEELWNTPVPRGLYRYYDGLLYMMAMLQVSGNFRIYDPTGKPAVDCPDGLK
jgi:oligosaccharide reducing-end xylanase